MNRRTVVTAAGMLVLLAAGARAHDPWDLAFNPDDTALSKNTLSPGLVQQHDLDEGVSGIDDVDWAVVPTLDHHSYEARLSGTNAGFDWGTCMSCAKFQRVDETGLVLTEDVSVVNEGTGATPESYDRSLRWIAGGDNIRQYVRVKGAFSQTENAGSVYTLRYWDTTYSIPRWNASGTQTTVIVITSLVPTDVTGSIHFFGGDGSLVHAQPLALTRNTPYVLNAASVPALVGKSGFALVSHTAGYGGLTGKAVALEPSTGFTFDTPLQPVPQ